MRIGHGLSFCALAASAWTRSRGSSAVTETPSGDISESTCLMRESLNFYASAGRPDCLFKAVHASLGKVVRAEPVSALYEQGRVHHWRLHQLEDQCCAFSSDFDRAKAGYSPDRVDALVWALERFPAGLNRSAFPTR
jgi:hypothetical protein